jgi:class 3 adenylate cyclase
MTMKSTVQTLQSQLDAMVKFPDQNPNPVLKTDMAGKLLYANGAGQKIVQGLGTGIGEKMPTELTEHAGTAPEDQLELPIGNRTFAFHVVAVPEFGFINIYGTDVTAMKAITKFPDQNPNPVLKTDMAGKLLYANGAGQKIVQGLGTGIGEKMPTELTEHAGTAPEDQLELPIGNRTFAFHVVAVPEFGFINIYGTDVTAMKAITKFPDQNPNPVLKTDMAGKLLYANDAGKRIQEGLGVALGERMPEELTEHAGTAPEEQIEIQVGGSTYTFHVVAVPEFGFINIYGTDITAAKDNEQILIKLAKYFSPQVYASIFSGDLEVKIQTKRKKLTVFFSDIKGFSEITERLEPEALTELITGYLTAMTDIAVKHGGTVDKYIGDAIMVFFGDPKSRGQKEDALACVQMAMEMKSTMHGFRRAWQNRGISQPLDIRIGIHTDTCTVGNFGSHDRLDYTTIGNGVNLASRLESNARTNQILISEDTYLLVREAISCEKLEKITVKNIKHPIQTYEVKGLVGDSYLSKMDESHDGFSLFIDPENIGDIVNKRQLLQEALELLNRLD